MKIITQKFGKKDVPVNAKRVLSGLQMRILECLLTHETLGYSASPNGFLVTVENFRILDEMHEGIFVKKLIRHDRLVAKESFPLALKSFLEHVCSGRTKNGFIYVDKNPIRKVPITKEALVESNFVKFDVEKCTFSSLNKQDAEVVMKSINKKENAFIGQIVKKTRSF